MKNISTNRTTPDPVRSAATLGEKSLAEAKQQLDSKFHVNTRDDILIAKDEPMDEERKYLEGLLKDRFNFFLVFASLLIAGIVTADPKNLSPTDRQMALLAGLLVSVLIWMSVLRTHILVNRALNKLETNHPYKIITEKPIPLLGRANTYLAVLTPGVMIILFAGLLWHSVCVYGWFYNPA